MIYYFSGTGNSRYVANLLGEILDEDTYYIPHARGALVQPQGNTLGFVFPVYSWGVPPIVIEFFNKLKQEFIDNVKKRAMPVWCVMTCGDEAAMAPEMFVKALQEREVNVQYIASVIMPNNYVLIPGFNVDPKEVEQRKLEGAPARIDAIAAKIKSLPYQDHKMDTIIDVVRGSWPHFKSKMIYPLFKHWGILPKSWRYTDACISCGLCARLCPSHNISMVSGKPVWSINCCSCLTCFHACPRNAVQYAKLTLKKGQYMLPESLLQSEKHHDDF